MDANKVVELWDKYEMPDCIRQHCIRVSALAIIISEVLITKGEKIDVDLVKYGALLHDIAKINEINGLYKEHNILGRNILIKEGFSEIAKVCEEHFLNYLDQHLLKESFIVNLADKLTNPDGYVTLKERFQRLYDKHPKYKETFDKTFILFEKEFKKIFKTEKRYVEITKDLNKKLDFKNKKCIDIISEL
jgi:putative nucleotidyltransferase with HDIG domain